jgi:hypothetical protein
MFHEYVKMRFRIRTNKSYRYTYIVYLCPGIRDLSFQPIKKNKKTGFNPESEVGARSQQDAKTIHFLAKKEETITFLAE